MSEIPSYRAIAKAYRMRQEGYSEGVIRKACFAKTEWYEEGQKMFDDLIQGSNTTHVEFNPHAEHYVRNGKEHKKGETKVDRKGNPIIHTTMDVSDGPAPTNDEDLGWNVNFLSLAGDGSETTYANKMAYRPDLVKKPELIRHGKHLKYTGGLYVSPLTANGNSQYDISHVHGVRIGDDKDDKATRAEYIEGLGTYLGREGVPQDYYKGNKEWEDSDFLPGFKVKINPKTHREFKDVEDLISTLDSNPEWWRQHPETGEWYLSPNRMSKLSSPIYSWGFPRSYIMSVDKEGWDTKPYIDTKGRRILLPGDLQGEPQRYIYHTGGVIADDTWDPAKEARPEKRDWLAREHYYVDNDE